MKIHLISLFCLLTVSCVKAQDYSNLQEKIGFLFADLPLSNLPELWLHQIELRKEQFADTTVKGMNNNVRPFIIKDLSSFRTITPEIGKAVLVISITPYERRDIEVRDTIIAIRVLLHLQPGISKKEAKKNYQKISSILIKTFRYSHLLFAGKSGSETIVYSNKKYDAFPKVQSSFGLLKEDNTYFIDLYFLKLKNGGQSE
ncbi:MAG: hypothetical protein ABL872_08820 [Lacibacter sp.]